MLHVPIGGGGRASFLSGEDGPWRGISFDWGGFKKNHRMGVARPLCFPYYGKPCENLKFIGSILKKYNVEIPGVNYNKN